MSDIKKENVYIDMLQELLMKKNLLLDELLNVTKNQQSILAGQNFEYQAFDDMISKKEHLIAKLEEYDFGFEKLYKNVQEELKDNKQQYKSQIQEMQDLIKQITNKSVSLKQLEIANKTNFLEHTKRERGKIRDFKVSQQAASNYYKSMANLQTQDSYFLDRKK